MKNSTIKIAKHLTTRTNCRIKVSNKLKLPQVAWIRLWTTVRSQSTLVEETIQSLPQI